MRNEKYQCISQHFYPQARLVGESARIWRNKLRDVFTVAGATLGLCSFMFVLYLIVLASSRVLQPITG